MARIKSGKETRARRKKVLELAKGYFGSKHRLYRNANEQVMRSLRYAFRDRKQRKRQFRKLWITRINAGAQLNGLKYNQLIHGLILANVTVNRKILSELATNDPKAFTGICDIAKEKLVK
jgi:large subunit ribosomal protein L20